jgi:hypothetical protein
MSRILAQDFEDALKNNDGILHPVLTLAHEDKDVILEIRESRIDLYCKGNVLFKVQSSGPYYDLVGPDRAFSNKPGFRINSADDLKSYIQFEIPFIKQSIACHRSVGGELEFEQAIVRAANFERANSHYLIADRQVSLPGRPGQIDCLGIYWPNHAIPIAPPVLCEVKYLTGAVSQLWLAIEHYYEQIRRDFERFKEDLQNLIQQKARLGLFPGLSAGAQRNLQGVKIVGTIDDMELVVALVDHSPSAGQRFLFELAKLPFASQIRILHLGFAMWKERAIRLPTFEPGMSPVADDILLTIEGPEALDEVRRAIDEDAKRTKRDD